MSNRRPHCIVIGAGLAGLAAAHKLSNQRWHITILEANSDRVGGRVFSHRFPESASEKLVCELGGEWIGDDHTRMKRLCREFGLGRLKSHQFSTSFWPSNGLPQKRFKPGQWPFSPKALRGFKRLRKRFMRDKDDEDKMRDFDQSDWWTTLGRSGFSLQELVQRDLMDSTDSGESIRLSSSYLAATEYFDSNDTDEMDFKIEGGNDRLPAAMAEHLGKRHELRLGASVRRIEQDDHGVRVFIEGRTRAFRGDYCICTVPAHRLLDITWRPILKRKQANASRQLQYSRIMKTAVLYAQRFWERPRSSKEFGFSTFTSRASDFCFDSTFGQRGTMGILCSYSIGDKADDLAAEKNPNNLMKWITEDVVCAVQPKSDVVVAPVSIATQAWHRETAIGGAYAFYRPGQWFTVREVLSWPHKRVAFAGEHLSKDWQGFMEGAVETGEAAATLVHRAISRAPR